MNFATCKPKVFFKINLFPMVFMFLKYFKILEFLEPKNIEIFPQTQLVVYVQPTN